MANKYEYPTIIPTDMQMCEYSDYRLYETLLSSCSSAKLLPCCSLCVSNFCIIMFFLRRHVQSEPLVMPLWTTGRLWMQVCSRHWWERVVPREFSGGGERTFKRELSNVLQVPGMKRRMLRCRRSRSVSQNCCLQVQRMLPKPD